MLYSVRKVVEQFVAGGSPVDSGCLFIGSVKRIRQNGSLCFMSKVNGQIDSCTDSKCVRKLVFLMYVVC